MNRYRRPAIVASIAGALILVAWPAAPGQFAPPKDELVIGIDQEPNILVPGLGGPSGISMVIQYLLFAQGVRFDDHGTLIPMQAREIPTLANGLWKLLPGKRMQLTWHLKPLKWHDGEPVTALDFVFTHRAIMNDKVPVFDRNFEKHVENVHAAGPNTLVVTFKEHYAYANNAVIQFGPWPRHLLEHAYQTNPGGLDKLPYGNDPVATIGNGPYRIVSWRKGTEIVAEAYPGYTLDRPKIKRIVWRLFPDTNTLVANMLAGQLDVTGVSFDQAAQMEKQIAQRRLAMKVLVTPSLVWEQITLNLSNPKFMDKRVRQGLLYALDRQAITTTMFQGRQPVADSYLPPQHYGFDPNVPKYTYNPERAKQLFQESGWTPGLDGVLRNSQGERFTITISTTAGNRIRETAEQIFQSYWRKVGVDLRISNQPARVLFGQTLAHREFDMMESAWTLGPQNDCERLFTSDNIPSAQNAYSGRNYSGFSDPEMDQLCHAIAIELDDAKRVAMLHRTQAILADELPTLPLLFLINVSVIKTGLVNWKPALFSPITWNATEWTWKQ